MNSFPWKRLSVSSSNALSYCYKEKRPCVGWVHKYFKDCLCNLSDDLSFLFGMVSLVAWGVAEIPQIITNFQTKSSHGVSILFLLTWIIGDVFNLVGCVLEPATLPTQLYTALLYTASTVVLVLQSLYYDYLYSWLQRRQQSNSKLQRDEDKEDDAKKPLNPSKPVSDEQKNGDAGIRIPNQTASREFYYTSARSLAGSDTPPFRSYLGTTARSGPSALGGLGHEYNSSEEEETENPPTTVKRKTTTQPRSIPRAFTAAAVVMAAHLPVQSNGLRQAYWGFTGRRHLQEQDIDHSAVGEWLGWLMAAIYMGGRIPQIVLNIKRGSVEGLNPLMFIFALIANIAYVASILVRSTDWEIIKADMPWLLDAVVCVALDLFIILQYVYYKYLRRKRMEFDEVEKDYSSYYMETN